MAHENDYDTTVLSDDYGDYHDTVVDQVIAFDPQLFQQSGSAGPAVGGMPAPPVQHDPNEDTWVLGSGPAAQPSQSWQPAGASASTDALPYASAASAPFAPAAQTFAPAPAQAFQRPSDAWQTVPRATTTMMAAADSKPDKANTKFIIAIVALAVVAVVAIILVVALLLASPNDPVASSASVPAAAVAPSSSSSASSAAAATSEPDSKSDAEPDSKSEASTGTKYNTGPRSSTIVGGDNNQGASEEEFYETLSKLYDQAGDYDSSIRQMASDFNENYLKEDKATRTAKANAVSSLKTRVKSSWDAVSRLQVPFGSRNTQACLDMKELYECLYYRIDVIDQAWKIDLQYDKPKEHQDEIVAPLRAQQQNGNDKYYTRFNELYPQINLVKP